MSYFMAISFSHLDMVFWRDLSQISFDCRGQKPISVSSNNKTKTKTVSECSVKGSMVPNHLLEVKCWLEVWAEMESRS